MQARQRRCAREGRAGAPDLKKRLPPRGGARGARAGGGEYAPVTLTAEALDAAAELMERVRRCGSLAVDVDAAEAPPGARAAAMADVYGGKMLGVLVGSRRRDGARVTLKAFSGQLPGYPEGAMGSWFLQGWAAPLAGLTHHDGEYQATLLETHALTRAIGECEPGRREDVKALKEQRRALSNGLLARIRASYDLSDQGLTLDSVYAPCPVPGGAGDCAAAKLVLAAKKQGVEPEGMCEWWAFSDTPKGGGRRAGRVYSACGRCQRLLPAMLGEACQEPLSERRLRAMLAETPRWLEPHIVPHARIDEWAA